MTLTPPPSQDVIVVGASGDLAARKLLPALYNLEAERLLPERCHVVGVAVDDWDDERFRDHAGDVVRQFSRSGFDGDAFARLAARLRYVPAVRGKNAFAGVERALQCDRRIAYLAVPPSAFTGLIEQLQGAGLADGTSIIIEKPFGHDLGSARQLNRELHAVVPEERIFRIDHYLGKETVQNLLVFRFGNAVLERLWNRDSVKRVEITVAEELGVEHRGAFYEETGAIRDIVQNHLFQLLSLTAMEPPTSFDAEALRNEKVKVLNAVDPVGPGDLVRGQYAAGKIGGQPVAAYRDEPGVSPSSRTETFAALRLNIDSWRWAGVPFLLRTGKRLARRDTRIVVFFRDVPLHLFGRDMVDSLDCNRITIRVQPQEGISFGFVAKVPGPTIDTQPVRMDFDYGTSFKTSPPEAYERLLHDALKGDHTLFIREDEVERGWAVVEPILSDVGTVFPYPAGSWGPAEADPIAAPEGWRSFEDGG